MIEESKEDEQEDQEELDERPNKKNLQLKITNFAKKDLV